MAGNSDKRGCSEKQGCYGILGFLLICIGITFFSNGSIEGTFFFTIIGLVLVIVGAAGSGSESIIQTTTESPKLPTSPVPRLESPRLPTPSVPSRSNLPESLNLQFKVSAKYESIEGSPIEILSFHTKGFFSIKRKILRPCFECRMSDVTNGSDSIIGGIPLLCIIDDLQDEPAGNLRTQNTKTT